MGIRSCYSNLLLGAFAIIPLSLFITMMVISRFRGSQAARILTRAIESQREISILAVDILHSIAYIWLKLDHGAIPLNRDSSLDWGLSEFPFIIHYGRFSAVMTAVPFWSIILVSSQLSYLSALHASPDRS